MTNLKQVSTTELVTELLARAKHTDALIGLVDAAKYNPGINGHAGTHRQNQVSQASYLPLILYGYSVKGKASG